jgi:hypothetical protein
MLMFLIGLILGVGITAGLMSIVSSSTRFEEVENKNPKLGADSKYWILTADETDYLFTKEQLKVAEERALKNLEDFQDNP